MATGTTGRKVFVIIDATHERHLALERLVITSEIEEPDTRIPLFISSTVNAATCMPVMMPCTGTTSG